MIFSTIAACTYVTAVAYRPPDFPLPSTPRYYHDDFGAGEEEDDGQARKAGLVKRKGKKTCPSCDEPVPQSATVCEFCDHVFTGATRPVDEAPPAQRFSFEVERVRTSEDDSLMTAGHGT
jgi:hypothetical protein